MNRYEQYVPVKLDYKPYVPNFENWAKVLTQQQQKYDTFEQAFTLANPEHIKQDSREYKIWQDYMQNTKDEVKNAFLKDAKYGNQKLKNKMFELQKEMQGGLYKGLETRYNEYQAASQQLSEEIKDQPWYKQEHYKDQFKANPMNYNNGQFSHISPVTTTKNAERNKRLMEYTKAIVPPHIAEQAIRFNKQGEYGAAGMWMVNESVVKDYMDPTEFRSKIQAYINANPDLQEDVQIEASVRNKRLDESTKKELVNKNISGLTGLQEQLNKNKQEKLSFTNEVDIKRLQKLYDLPQTGIMDADLKSALDKDYNTQIQRLEDAKSADSRSIIFDEILNTEARAFYPLIPNKQEVTTDMKANDYYKLQLQQDFDMNKMKLDHAFRARQNQLNREAADRRNQAMISAQQQMMAQSIMTGDVQESNSVQNPLTALGYKQAAENEYQGTKTTLEAQILEMHPEFKLLSPSARTAQLNQKADDLMKMFNTIRSVDLQSKTPEEQKKYFDLFGLDILKGKTAAQSLALMDEYTKNYKANKSAKSKYDNVSSMVNTNTAGYKELTSFIDNEYNKLSKGYDLYDEQGNKLDKGSFAALIGSGRNIVTKSKNTGIPGGWLGSIYDIQTPSLDAIDGINEHLRKTYSGIINKHPELQTNNILLGDMYIDKNRKGEYYTKLQSSTIPALETEFKAGKLKSILDDNQTATFTRHLGNGEVEELTYKEMIEKYGFKSSNMDVYPDMTEGYPGFSVYFTNKKGQNFSAKVGLSGKMKTQMSGIALNMMQTAKIAGNQEALNFWTRYHGSVSGDLPNYSFSNNNVPGDPATTSEGVPVTIAYSKTSPRGFTLGTIKEGDNFFLGYKNKEGKWDYVIDNQNQYIHSDNARDINNKVYQEHIGNAGTVMKITSVPKSLSNYVEDDEDVN